MLEWLQSVMNSAARLVFSSFNIGVRLNLSISPPITLAEGSWKNPVQTCCSDVQVFAQDSVIPDDEFLSLRTSMLEVVFAQHHHHHLSSIIHSCELPVPERSSCCYPCLEGTAPSHHVCSVPASFLQSSEDSSFQPIFLTFCGASEVICHWTL